MNNDLEIDRDLILKAAKEVCDKPSYFDDELINQKYIIDLIYKKINNSMINKKVIYYVISSFIKIICEAIINNETVKIYKLGSLILNDKNKIEFNPSAVLRNLINSESIEFKNLNIFKIINTDEGIFIIDPIRNESQWQDDLFVFNIKQTKKIKLSLKKINISYDPEIKKYNKKIIINMIRKYSNTKYLDKEIINKIIQHFLYILTEAFVIGIKIKLPNLGVFYPKKTRLKKSTAKYLLFMNGKFKEFEFIGRLDIGLRPSEKLRRLIKNKKFTVPTSSP